jgi:aspartate/methionine/tyrosine aminotransferase
MAYPINEAVAATMAPPISDAFSWIPSYSGKASASSISARRCRAIRRRTRWWSASRNSPTSRAGTSIPTSSACRPCAPASPRRSRRDYGGDADVEDVAITAGCNQAFCLAIAAIARPGDNVILPLPYFFNHHMWLAMQGIEPRLFESERGAGDAERAEALVDQRTRAVVLVSPDNPTGIVRAPEAILALYEMAERRGIALVIDETYKDFRGFAAPAHPLFEQPRWRDTFVHLYSFSKAFALTGYRVGAVAAAPRLVGEIEKLMDCLAICAPHVSQAAVDYA